MMGCSRDANGEESGIYYRAITQVSRMPSPGAAPSPAIISCPMRNRGAEGQKGQGGQQGIPPGRWGGRTA